MALSESQTIYYGLQCLVGFAADELGRDKLFSVRAACVPVDDWSKAMWLEAARVVGAHHKHLPPQFINVVSFPVISQERRRGPSAQAYVDAREATPRPTEDQLDRVKAMAEHLRREHQATKERFDVELTPDLGFAIVRRPVANQEAIRRLPGFQRTDVGAQVWLSPDLEELVRSHNLKVAPDVLPAIAHAVEHINRQDPWALVLEKASSCADPAFYPTELAEALKSLNLRGVRWAEQGRARSAGLAEE